MNRGQQSNAGRPSTVFSAGAPADPEQQAPRSEEPEHKGHHEKPAKHTSPLGPIDSKWFRWGGGTIVIIIALLIAAALTLFITFRPANEADLVDPDKLQAVFLTNDQVYFGDIADINSKYLVLTNIYYLQTTTSNSANKTSTGNVQLVKLGCELHKPQDRMVIKQDQVSFWENLQDNGKVAEAVKSYEEANPNGQTCDTTSTNTNPVQGSNETQNTQNTTNTNNTSNNTTNNSTNNTDDTTNDTPTNNGANQ